MNLVISIFCRIHAVSEIIEFFGTIFKFIYLRTIFKQKASKHITSKIDGCNRSSTNMDIDESIFSAMYVPVGQCHVFEELARGWAMRPDI